MRLIDADALKEDILGLRDCDNGFSDTYDKACIIGVIDEQPTAEPEVLACGEGELSAEPDDAALHESCTDCPLYDHDRHRCPRFNKVIPTTVQEILETQTQRWIPVTERLPENYMTVLITHRGGISFGWYNGQYWERGASTRHRKLMTVIAWMPLPEPYRGEGQE